MPTYGLTATGFLPKTLEIIRDEINGALTDYFGPSLDLENGILARIVGIVAERLAELWELAEAVNSAQDPDKAAAAALDALCLLTGTFRLAAAYSEVALTLTGTPTTVVPAASRASTSTTGAKFITKASATITAAAAWVASTGYAAGNRRTNASRVYQCITAGTSAGSGGPTTTSTDITDGTAHWRYLGEGTGVIDADAQSVDTGAIVAVSGDITVIETPVGGWSSVANLLDADLGYAEQGDESLRLTREEELSQAGTSTADAIRAALLELDDTSSVTIFENTSDVEVDGMPPHSVEALVRGGEDEDIAQTLLDQIAAGIGSHGNTSADATSSEGVTTEMFFSRPVEINIGVDVILTKDPATYPADGDDQVKAAIVAFGDAQRCGKNAVASSVLAQAFKVAGVLDVTTCEISSAAAPSAPPAPTTSATIAIAPRELAVFDTSWITVTTSDGTP